MSGRTSRSCCRARPVRRSTDSQHDNPVAPTLLERDITATGPNRKRGSDISYIWTSEGRLHLAIMVESAFKTLKAELVCGPFFRPRQQAELALGRYIDGFYNPSGHDGRRLETKLREVLTPMTHPEHGNPEAAAPLILTLQLDAAAQARFDAERDVHFPLARNYLSAHLTLFHHLPGSAADAIGGRLRAVCERQPCFTLEVHDLWMMGRGVAYRLRSSELIRLHAGLAEPWRDWLTPQDRQPLRPHVTIQNKVGAEQARVLHDRLRSGFTAFEAKGTGLLLWHYRGGPWEPAAAFPFSDA